MAINIKLQKIISHFEGRLSADNIRDLYSQIPEQICDRNSIKNLIWIIKLMIKVPEGTC